MMNILARIALLLTAIASLGVQATPKVTYYHNDLLGITKARKMNDGLRLFAAKISAWLALLAGMALSGVSHAGTITYYHNDLLGSPVAATNASGQVIWRESYRPYGERLTNDPNSTGNKVWFTSRRQDAETGLVYMGARYYDPVAGRFLSVDPKGFNERNVHSHSRYAYANNNPLKYIDPDGKDAFIVYHPALDITGNPAFHTAILLVPNKPSDFADRLGWNVSLTSDRISATLGAQAWGGSVSSDNPFGTLRNAPNYGGDAEEKATGRVRLEPPNGVSDTEWINSLIKAANSYGGDARYSLGPSGYNSNSLVSGVVTAVGGSPPTLPVWAPGYDRPLPLPQRRPDAETN